MNFGLLVCSLLGHSDITEFCFGYHSCARCGTQLGDSLGGAYLNEREVIINHRPGGKPCKACRTNYKILSWKDKLFVQDPFKE